MTIAAVRATSLVIHFFGSNFYRIATGPNKLNQRKIDQTNRKRTASSKFHWSIRDVKNNKLKISCDL